MVLAAATLLGENPHPTDDEIRHDAEDPAVRRRADVTVKGRYRQNRLIRTRRIPLLGRCGAREADPAGLADRRTDPPSDTTGPSTGAISRAFSSGGPWRRRIPAKVQETYGGDLVSTWSVLRLSCKRRSPVGLLKQPEPKASAKNDLALAA
jgi:hypothetical protein